MNLSRLLFNKYADFICFLKTGFEERQSRNKCYYYDFDLPGYDLDLGNIKTDTARECRMLCYFTRECAQFTWLDKTFDDGVNYRLCRMKKVLRNNYVYRVGAISGHKYCGKETYEGTIYQP